MRTLRRNNQTIYIAQIDTDAGVDKKGNFLYKVPFKLRINLAPLDSSSDIEIYGNRIKNMYQSVVSRSIWEDRIKENGVAYLFGASPLGEKANGSKANYNIESIRYTLNTMTIYFEKKP